MGTPIMWGTDEDTGHLIKVENYYSTPLVTDYGKLSIEDGEILYPFPDSDPEDNSTFTDIESFTLDDDGVAFMIGNSTVMFEDGGTYSSPHLFSLRVFRFDGTESVRIDDAMASNGYNALSSIGPITGIDDDDPINGLDFDPVSGRLFAVVENGGRDDLIVIDVETAVATIIASSMNGTNDIEDIQFDHLGNLYLIDDDGGESESDDILHIVTLDHSGAMPSLASIQTVNNTGGDPRIEALGWDFQNHRLIAFSDTSNSLFHMNTETDGYTDLGGVGFNDIEGIDFVPTQTGLPIPEPSTALLVSIGLAAFSLRKGKAPGEATAS